MAASLWRRWFGLAPQPDEAGSRRRAEEDEQHKKLRHDFGDALHAISLKTDEARQALDVIDGKARQAKDAIDAQVDYLKATGRRRQRDEQHDDRPDTGAGGPAADGGNP